MCFMFILFLVWLLLFFCFLFWDFSPRWVEAKTRAFTTPARHLLYSSGPRCGAVRPKSPIDLAATTNSVRRRSEFAAKHRKPRAREESNSFAFGDRRSAIAAACCRSRSGSLSLSPSPSPSRRWALGAPVRGEWECFCVCEPCAFALLHFAHITFLMQFFAVALSLATLSTCLCQSQGNDHSDDHDDRLLVLVLVRSLLWPFAGWDGLAASSYHLSLSLELYLLYLELIFNIFCLGFKSPDRRNYKVTALVNDESQVFPCTFVRERIGITY